MKIGKRIYYEKATGIVIISMGERSGGVFEKTMEQDFDDYVVLSERNPETVGCLQLEYGQYAEDFGQCDSYRVDPVTKQLLFRYPDPNEPEQPPVYRPPLSEQVEQLESQNLMLAEAIADLYEMMLGAG